MSYATIIASILLFATQATPESETRSDQVVGFGLVVGLPGTGGQGEFTRQVAADLLESEWGVPRWLAQPVAEVLARGRVVSAVMVTAEIRSNMQLGERSITAVASLDDASSVGSGILMTTRLRASDGNVYAVAWGVVSGDKNGVGRIPDGARVTQRIRH